MIWALLGTIAYGASYGISRYLNDRIDEIFLEEYHKISDSKGGYWPYVKRLIEEHQAACLSKIELLNIIPIINVLFPYIRFKLLDLNLKVIESQIDWVEARVLPSTGDDNYIDKKSNERIIKKYFISYYTEENKRIYIWFEYDGDTLSVSDETSDVFKKLPIDIQINTLLYFLYNIYIGNDSLLNSSLNIRDIFNEELVDKLICYFERESKNVEIELTLIEETNIIRKRRKE